MVMRCGALLMLLSVGLAQEPKPPSGDELWKTIPEIGLPDPQIRSLELEGWGGLHKQLRWHFLYKAPAKYALYAWGADGVPVAAYAQTQLLVAESYRGQVLYSSDLGLRFTINVDGEDFRFGFFFPATPKGERPHNRVHIDLSSLKQLLGPKMKVKAQGGKRYRLSAKSKKGNLLVADFDLASRWPFHAIGMFETKEPTFAVTRFAVNGDVPDSAFAFPDMKEWKDRLGVDRVDMSTPGGSRQVQEAIMLSMRTRAALEDPKIQAKLDKEMDLGPADWKKIAERHEKLSALLKQALPAPPKSKAPEPPADWKPAEEKGEEKPEAEKPEEKKEEKPETPKEEEPATKD